MNNEVRHCQWQYIIEELLSAALWFHFNAAPGWESLHACAWEEKGEKKSWLIFLLLTYILNLATCLTYSMLFPGGAAIWASIMLPLCCP